MSPAAVGGWDGNRCVPPPTTIAAESRWAATDRNSSTCPRRAPGEAGAQAPGASPRYRGPDRRTCRGPRTRADIPCMSPSAPGPACRRSGRTRYSHSSRAPSPSRAAALFASPSSPCRWTTCTSSLKQTLLPRSSAAFKAWPYVAPAPSTAARAALAPYGLSATTPGQSARPEKCAWRWPTCCSTSASTSTPRRASTRTAPVPGSKAGRILRCAQTGPAPSPGPEPGSALSDGAAPAV
jgi:hypothetical protein